MDQTLIYIISALLSLLVMVGIALMSKVRYASLGNSLSALAILAGIVFTLLTKENNGTPIITAWSLYPSLIIGTLIGGDVCHARKNDTDAPVGCLAQWPWWWSFGTRGYSLCGGDWWGPRGYCI